MVMVATSRLTGSTRGSNGPATRGSVHRHSRVAVSPQPDYDPLRTRHPLAQHGTVTSPLLQVVFCRGLPQATAYFRGLRPPCYGRWRMANPPPVVPAPP